MRGWKDAGMLTVLATPDPNKDKGEVLYNAHCATCHQGDGTGLPAHFPPLKGDEVVNAPDPITLVRAILFGVKGVEIKGVKYEAQMPHFDRQLSDEEIAAIATFTRSHWGNYGPKVNPAVVTEARKTPPAQGPSDAPHP
ncbi:MAG: Cbb3-type cytochrome oxidase, cytochrome c subunit [Cyanobacteria bacterium RYN_339]|nr:Cbb3-type cytochrome oxidase, cytochrome c subunit [Cyanobacteria bacterium RYN_339]